MIIPWPRRWACIAACLLMSLSCPPCIKNVSAAPETVVDFRASRVIIKQPVKRIVCLIESALSGLFMLGAQEKVVGISTNVYQADVYAYYAAMDPRIDGRQLPSPGNWDFVNIESVVALNPDLVVIWAHQKEAIAAMEERGIRVYGVEINRFADIEKEIEDLGVLTGRSGRAQALIRYARDEQLRMQPQLAVNAIDQRPGVYFMWAQGDMQTAGGPSTVNELITLAGGRNVCGHIQQEHLVVNLENLLLWDPDVVVMWTNPAASPETMMAKSTWSSIRAVRQRRVHELPNGFTCDLWTLKYLLAVKLVATWCHPGQRAGLDLVQEARSILGNLYGRELVEGMPLEKILH